MSVSYDVMPVLSQLSKLSEEELEQVGFSLEERYMLDIITDPIKWAKEFLGWNARDYQETILMQGATRNRTVLRLGRRLGKCMPGEVRILDPSTGERVPLHELYEKKMAKVASMSDDYEIIQRYTSKVWDNGMKEVFLVKMTSGRELKATGNHPLYRVDGWTEIDDIEIGDFIAVPKSLPFFGNDRPSDDEIKKVASDVRAGGNVPKALDTYAEDRLALFLDLLFKDDHQIFSLRKKPLQEVQHYLLRFGRNSYIRKINAVYKLALETKKEDPNLIEEESFRLAEEGRLRNKEMLRPSASMTNYGTSSVTPVDLREILSKDRLNAMGQGEIQWDEVESIESIGMQQTYDMTVDDTRNFVAEDIITHNTECMVVLILWYAFTQINRDPEKSANDPYDILILTPAEKQSVLIYDRIRELIEGSDALKGSITRDVFLRIELANNTCIQLMTLGTGNGSGAASIRGQRADLLVYDEADYIGEDELANTLAIANEDKLRIRVIAASTPSGDRKSYYDWCTGASHSFEADVQKIEDTGEVSYNYINRPGREGNGWTQVYAPSTVNKKLLETNPDTGMTAMEELREEFTDMKFEQEVMANFGESESGVYQKKYIDAAVELGRTLGVAYQADTYGRNLQRYVTRNKRILGIDWDHVGNPTNMVGVEYNEEFGIYVPFLRVEIPQSEYTYDNAVKKVIQLHEAYDFDWIVCDAGHGEAQIQYLKKYGMENPSTGLHHKVIRVNFSEKIDVRDPFTMKKVKQHIKPFMVNNVVRAFERGHIVLNPEDKQMIKQFTDYHIVRIGQDGRPIFTDVNEHIHDCVILAIHGFILKYSDMLKVKTTVHMAKLDNPNLGMKSIVERELPETKEEKKPIPEPGQGYLIASTVKRKKGYRPFRRVF